jgi:2-(1,2-epoxy-1,2-dihydrophenyl)acetyl-CoA isomerase
MAEPLVRYEEEGFVGVITLNRPAVLNAFDHGMVLELAARLDAARDAGMRALVVTGAGRAFSSGHDLHESAITGATPMHEVHGYLWEIQHLTTRILEHPAIVIVALNGPAVGMAAELCVAADLRLASDEAYLLFPEVRLALLETNGVTWLLPRAVGHARASDWLLTGRRIPAAELATAGLVSRVVPGRELLPATMELAREIAASAPRSIRLVKRLLHRGWSDDLRASLLAEIDGVVETSRSPDLVEGVQAFHEKRVPRYTGD